MKARDAKGALLTALVLAGCAVQPNTPTTGTAPAGDVQIDEQGSPVTRAYVVQSAQAAPVAIRSVTASSSSIRDPRWWDVKNAIDGNRHSAWMPADDDMTPTLTLDLGGETAVSALAIKMDESPITFDLAVWRNGAWETVATGLKPSRYQALDYLDLPDQTTSRLRLTFHGLGTTVGWHGEGPDRTPIGAKLHVCEVQAFANQAPTPAPSPTGTPSPQQGPCVRLTGFGTQFSDDGRNGYSFNFQLGVTPSGKIVGFVGGASTAGHSGERYAITSFDSLGNNDVVLHGQEVNQPSIKADITVHVADRQGPEIHAYVSHFRMVNQAANLVYYDIDYSPTYTDDSGRVVNRGAFIGGSLAACEPDNGGCVSLEGVAGVGGLTTGLQVDLRYGGPVVSTEVGGFGRFDFYDRVAKSTSQAEVREVFTDSRSIRVTGAFHDIVIQGGAQFHTGTFAMVVDRATGALVSFHETLEDGTSHDWQASTDGALTIGYGCAF